MASRWTNAATILPPTVEVCGYRLLPFCLRHRVALEAISSPVLLTDLPMTPEHLIAAARILSTHDVASVRRPASLRDRYYINRLSFSRSAMTAELVKLHAYIVEQSLWPRFWAKEESAGSNGIPWTLAVVSSLIRNGCTLTEAWTMPEAEAIWLHVSHCKADGGNVSIVSDEEWEAMARFKQAEADASRTTRPSAKN